MILAAGLLFCPISVTVARMLVIRLKRIGRRNDPSFRIVVGEKIYSPKSGKHLAQLGSYNPKTKASVIDDAAVKEWMSKGAKLSDTVHNLFLKKGIITGKKINVLPAFKAAPVEEKPAEAPAAEAAPVEEAVVVEEVTEAPPSTDSGQAAEAPAEEAKAE